MFRFLESFPVTIHLLGVFTGKTGNLVVAK